MRLLGEELSRCLSGGTNHTQVITQLDEQGHKLEPYEEAVVEVPESHMGGVVDLMGSRKGQMQDMSASTEGLNRVTYRIPTRGLLGLRNAILTATKVCLRSFLLFCVVLAPSSPAQHELQSISS